MGQLGLIYSFHAEAQDAAQEMWVGRWEEGEVLQEERLVSQSPAGSEESGALYRSRKDAETTHGLRTASSLLATDVTKYPRLSTL